MSDVVTTTSAAPETHTRAPATVHTALAKAGWRQVEQAPWLWVRGDVALPWEEAAAASMSAPAARDPLSRLERVLHSEQLMTIAPVALGLLADAIPLIIPAAQMLAPPMGTMVGGVLGLVGRALSAHLKARKG